MGIHRVETPQAFYLKKARKIMGADWNGNFPRNRIIVESDIKYKELTEYYEACNSKVVELEKYIDKLEAENDRLKEELNEH